MAANLFDQFDVQPPVQPASAASGNLYDQFDVPIQQEKPAPEETAGRVIGLGERALIQGIGHLADTPGALLSLADRAGLSLHNYTRKLMGLGEDKDAPPPMEAPTPYTDMTNLSADTMGLPKPATPGERIASSAVSALPSAILAPEAPIAGGIGAMLGGGTSQAVAEAGGSPLQQTLAGLAAGSVPALASGAASGARALVRDQGDTAARIADATASGTRLTAGQATDSKLLQSIEGSSSKLWGGGTIKNLANQQTQDIGNNVDRIVNNLAPKADVSPTGAGTAINAGGAATKVSMRAAEKAAYDKVDALVHPDTPTDVSSTLAKLDDLSTPTPGAEKTTASLVSPRITQMRDNLQADLAANGSTSIPYSAASELRTKLGNSIDWGPMPADPVANGALKLVHGALTGDRNAAATSVSPQAAQAVKDAGALYSQNSNTREFLESIIDKAGGPEAVYTAATNGTKQGATKISGVMEALDPGQQNLVRATVIDRLGKALPSQQNAAGDAFNASTFLTNWSKLDAKAKDSLFGVQGPSNTLRAGLDSFANTTSTIRNSKIFPNPSGTGEAVGHSIGLMQLLEGGGAALAGHPAHLGIVAGSVVGNGILARALTNPRTVSWLASTAKVPTSGLPNAINQLSRMGAKDPDARDLAALLQRTVN